MVHHNISADPKVVELERKSRELTRPLFVLCEKRISAHAGKPTPEHLPWRHRR